MYTAIVNIILSIIFIAGNETELHPTNRLKELFDTEQVLMETLKEYIQQQEIYLLAFESQLKELSATVSHSSHKEQHLSNPLNTLTLVRRLTTNWPSLVSLAGHSSILSTSETVWPGDSELQAVIRTVVRLQSTYNLSTEQLAHGRILGDPANANITADCVSMARYYYQQHQHSQAAQWLDQAITKHDSTVPTASILELAILSKCFSGDTVGSVSALATLLRDFPTHETSKILLSDWQLAASGGCLDAKLRLERKKATPFSVEVMEKFNWLCRGGNRPQPGLRCRYVHYNKTHLRLAPFLMEELQLDPPVLMFHNTVSDVDIVELKEKGQQKLSVSKIYTGHTTGNESPNRISESGSLYSVQSPVIDKLSRRMGDITNLDMSLAEPTQVTRYGLGGEYWFHHDFLGKQFSEKSGDRIATLMFYLSEVPQGGHTVFHHWQLSVRPQKGSALFWFNLHRNGNMDFSSVHAGCPVLEGTKWVMNKWFHEFNNEFTAPCLMDPKASFKYFYM